MEKRRQPVAVTLGGEAGEFPQYGRETFGGVAISSDYGSKLVEVTSDLALVPGREHRFDVGEVLVERGTSDPSQLGDLRHRHGAKPALGYESASGGENRVVHGLPVRLDGLVPKLGHVREGYPVCKTVRLDNEQSVSKNCADMAENGVPRWVKVSMALALVLMLVLATLLLVGGRLGDHGPGRHLPGGNSGKTHTGPPDGIRHPTP